MIYRNIIRRGYLGSRRSFHSTYLSCDLFGGFKTINQPPLQAPSGKGETTANPVDLIKKNDILLYSQKPHNYIETARTDGFYLANNILITSPNKNNETIGALLLDSESYEINLSKGGFNIEKNGFANFSDDVLTVLELIHPKPEILVVGLGKKSRMLSQANRQYISSLGIQLEVSDSTNAAHIFDLLATERPHVIGALLLPPNI